MNNDMKYFEDLYLKDLSKVITIHDKIDGSVIKTRCRVKNPGKWAKIKSTSKDGSGCIELNEQPWAGAPLWDPEKIWIWSDLHFGHNNIIGFSNRPFVGINHMNQCLIEYHNDHVQPDDISIWVGDVSFMNSKMTNNILSLCNGYKILIVGNHDFDRKKVKQMDFDEVHLVYQLKRNDMSFVLTHYPMENLPWPHFNVHGHIHIGGQWDWEKYGEQMYNVNCEFHGYKPITFAQIIEQCSKRNWSKRPTGKLIK